jgi:membrane protein
MSEPSPTTAAAEGPPAPGTLRSELREIANPSRIARTLADWPWFETARTLRRRFAEDRLGLTAGSLTFTTLIALVPLLTVMLALFSAFPMFGSFQVGLEKYFLQSLVPDSIARPVLQALTQFASKARGLGTAGLVFLVVTALALVLTIDKALNAIWRVRRPRPIAQRVLVYWAALTLGPLAIGISLTLTSYLLSAGKGLVAAVPGAVAAALNVVEFTLLMAAMAGLFHYVPNTPVRWRHAIAGGAFVALALEGAKQALGWYVSAFPVYRSIYGAFAAAPLLLLWVYLVWVIVLLGAVIAAYAPSLQKGLANRPASAGDRFSLCLAVLKELGAARARGEGGVALHTLAARLQTDPLRVDPALQQLIALNWAARLDEGGEPRHVLLCEPRQTPLAPLVHALLLTPDARNEALRRRSGLDSLTVHDATG